MKFTIEDGVLKDVELMVSETSMIIPDGVTSITGTCFDVGSVFSITIPECVSTIDVTAFHGFHDLENIYVSKQNPAYTTVDGILYNKELTELVFCPQKKVSVNIPLNVTRIGANAFYYCDSLISIEIPNSVSCIGESAFGACNSLTSIIIPGSVKNIADDAFANCSNLRSVTISEGVTHIGDSAFRECNKLESVTFPDSLTSIGELAFDSCFDLVFFIIPRNVTHIGGGAFSRCNLNRIDISEANRSFIICDGVLYDSKKTQIISCSDEMSNIIIPSSVTSIESSAFSGCEELTSVTIPNGVTTIGNAAFSCCSSLAAVTIPDSVISIGDEAFSSCRKLTKINIPPFVKSINNITFSSCESLTSVDIPNGVTYMGYCVFLGCKNLELVTIPGSVEKIEGAAFQDCPKLTISAPTNSYAESYARESGINFVIKSDNVVTGANHGHETRPANNVVRDSRNRLNLITSSEDQLYNDFYDSFHDSDEPFGGSIFLISVKSKDIASIIVERYADLCGESGLSKYDVVTSEDGIPVHLFRELGICMFEISNEGEYGGPLPESIETLTDIVKYWVKNFFRNDESRNFEDYELDQYIESSEYLEMMSNLKCKGTYYQGRFKYSEDISDCIDPSHMHGFTFAEAYIDDYISD